MEQADEEEYLLEQLDRTAQIIMEKLHDLGGEATTAEIRERMELDTNDPITYRLRRAETALEPAGLVEIEDPATRGEAFVPFTVTLTEHGEELAERIIEQGRQTSNLDERLAEMDDRLGAIEEQLDTLDRRIDQLTTSEMGAWNRQQQREFRLIQQRLHDVTGFLNEHASFNRDSLEALEQRETVVVDEKSSLERIEAHDRVIEQLFGVETDYFTDVDELPDEKLDQLRQIVMTTLMGVSLGETSEKNS